MGKGLRGGEIGVGICQTKDKKYVGRITTRNGKRVKRVFDKLADCRKWIADARYEDEHNTINAIGDMTVTAWFEYWITEIKGNNIRPNTILEAGMRPKTLQMILGHANIGITMNLYVHVTEEEKLKEIENIQESLNVAV